MNTTKSPLKPVTITLTPTEILSLSGVFSMFSVVMKQIELELPADLKRDMTSILKKMMDRVEVQLVQKAREN